MGTRDTATDAAPRTEPEVTLPVLASQHPQVLAVALLEVAKWHPDRALIEAASVLLALAEDADAGRRTRDATAVSRDGRWSTARTDSPER